jgi:glycosyltransferase involved in cell wall biosynthesis
MPCIEVEVIPNGVELPDISPSREWIPNGNLRLLYLGRLHPIKGIENLLRAVALLNDHSISLKIFGTGESSYVASLRALAESLGVQGGALFLGELAGDQKTTAFQCADVCVVPSFSENFGMVVAESLAHGVPVIAARGTPWADLEQRACGVWVDNTPSALAGAIRKMKDKDLRTMGRRGRSWMVECFGWDAIARRMRDCYFSLGERT